MVQESLSLLVRPRVRAPVRPARSPAPPRL